MSIDTVDTKEAIREQVRERYAGLLAPSRRLARELRQRLLLRQRSARSVRRGHLFVRRAGGASGCSRPRQPGVRQPHRRCRPERGRGRARPRLRRRHRRHPLREACRPDRNRLRPRHDRRDARPRAAERARGGDPQRPLPQGSDRGDPLPADSVDVVISNCVINLSADKPAVLTEIARVLRPGGRIGITDVVAEDRLSPEERLERGDFAGCIAGALSIGEYEAGLEAAGFEDVSVSFTHEVTDGIHGAIVKARMPADPAARPSRRPARDERRMLLTASLGLAPDRCAPCALPAQELVRDGAQRGSERREQVDPERVQLASC